MADIRLLERTLAQNVTWNKARINFLARFLLALIQTKTVNLSQVASVFAGRAKRESHYKRAQRFLRFFELPFAEVARLVARLAAQPAPWVITLDRTDWYLGETPLNVLLLGIAHEGVTFPLLWAVLPKKGCCDTAERIALVEEYLRLFGRSSIRFLCADREFLGRDWFSYLRREGIAFRLRVRANTKVTNGRGQSVQARCLFRQGRVGEAILLKGARRVLGQQLFVMGVRLPKGEYVIVCAPDESGALLEEYARRWEVETLFGCLKSRGFCLEATHVTDPERLRKLLALVALAFCWAHVVGEWLARNKPLPLKKHGRKTVSLFRHGFDYLRRILCNQLCEAERVALRVVIKLLSCT
jgi:Transposase DDE domain